MSELLERRDPRFVYLSDAAAGSSSQDAPGARFAWRLDAANHRPLGQAAAVVHSLDLCRAAARTLRGEIGTALLTIATDPAQSQWRWRLALGCVTVAVSPHSFARRVECQRAYDQFVAAVRLAEPDKGVVRHYGPRALRGFEVEISEDRTVCR